MPSAADLLAAASVVALPMATRFRGIDVREALLLAAPNGWAEWSPFVEYDDAEAATWLRAAVEDGWGRRPVPRRAAVRVNATIPAVAAEDVPAAAAEAREAMRLAPDDMLLRYEHLLGSERTGDLEGAAEDARQLLSRGVTGPLAGSLWFRVAEAARSRNDDEGQRSALEQALAADPSAVVARLALRDLLARTMDTSACLLYTSPSPRDRTRSRMPSSA